MFECAGRAARDCGRTKSLERRDFEEPTASKGYRIQVLEEQIVAALDQKALRAELSDVEKATLPKAEFNKLEKRVAALELQLDSLTASEITSVTVERKKFETSVVGTDPTSKTKELEGRVAALDEKSVSLAAEVENLRNTLSGLDNAKAPSLTAESSDCVSDSKLGDLGFATFKMEFDAWKETVTSQMDALEDRLCSAQTDGEDEEHRKLVETVKPESEDTFLREGNDGVEVPNVSKASMGDATNFGDPNTGATGAPSVESVEELIGTGFTSVEGDKFPWGASVWEACLLVWRKELGIFASLSLMAATGTNIVMQGVFCWVLLTDGRYTSVNYFADLLPSLHKWRVTEGHHYKYLGSEGVSLVARVCGLDSSLSIAGTQVSLLEEINAYFSFEDNFDLDVHGIPSGPALCLMCISFFTMIVIKELRQVFLFGLSLCMLPHSKTKLLERQIVSLSYHRLSIALALCAARIFIAGVLLVSGIMWLASTSSTQELILNVAALSVIMEIDEFLFLTMPERAIQLVGRLQSLHVPNLPFWVDACAKDVVFLTAVILGTILCVKPNMDDMLALKRELCGETIDFVVDHFQLGGMLISVDTKIFEDPVVDEASPWAKSVSEVRQHRARLQVATHWWNLSDASRGANWSMLTRDLNHFAATQSTTMREWGEGWPICADTDRIAELFNFLPFYNHIRARHILANVDRSGTEQSFSCSDYLEFCNDPEAMVLRLMCPQSCGCDNYASGISYPDTFKGCPLLCNEQAEFKLQSMPCMDADVTSSAEKANWHRYWRGWLKREALRGPAAIQEPFTLDMMSKGCDREALTHYSTAVATMFSTARHPCWDDVDKIGELGLIAFCPATCCKVFWHLEGCPRNCSI